MNTVQQQIAPTDAVGVEVNNQMQAETPMPHPEEPAVESAVLISNITRLLHEGGHPNPTEWVKGLFAMCPETVETTDLRMERFLINSYWRNALGNCDVTNNTDTTNARFSLVDDGEIEDWLRLFRDMVVPCIIQNHL